MILLQSLYPDKRAQAAITRKAAMDMEADIIATFHTALLLPSICWMVITVAEEDDTRR